MVVRIKRIHKFEDANRVTRNVLRQIHCDKEKANEYLKEHYPFPYEFASDSDIKSPAGKFADTTKYPFAHVIHDIYDNIKDFKTGFTRYTQDIIRFHLYDRGQKKDYADLGNGSTIYMWSLKKAIKRITDEKVTGGKK